jgi:hypothetical protein
VRLRPSYGWLWLQPVTQPDPPPLTGHEHPKLLRGLRRGSRSPPGRHGPSCHRSYKCSTSSKSIDDAGYSGPWPDNWDVTVQMCAARSGATIYAYADVRWDGPAFYSTNNAIIFDGAKIRLQIMQSREGTDPVVTEQDFPLKSRLEKPTPGGDRDAATGPR